MHELAITQSILDISRKAAEEHGARRIKSVRIMLGQYSGVVPQCIQYYFDVISKDTVAEGAVLDIQRLPAGKPDRPAPRQLSPLRQHRPEAHSGPGILH